jgi:hypothetical protein
MFLMLILATTSFCDDVETKEEVSGKEEVYHVDPGYDERSKLNFKSKINPKLILKFISYFFT